MANLADDPTSQKMKLVIDTIDELISDENRAWKDHEVQMKGIIGTRPEDFNQICYWLLGILSQETSQGSCHHAWACP